MRSAFLFTVLFVATAHAGEKPPPPKAVEYKDIEIGKGRVAADGDALEATLSAKLEDGTPTPVQSPYKWTLGRGQAIRGFDDGVRGMRAGGRRFIVVPSAYAYNDGRTFYFTVQLVSAAATKT